MPCMVTRLWNATNGGGAGDRPGASRLPFGSWYNPGRSSKKVLRAGHLRAGALAVSPAPCLTRLGEEGNRRPSCRSYVSSISAHEFLLGKILTFVVVAFCECILLLTLLVTYFGLNFAGVPVSALSLPQSSTRSAFVRFGTLIGSAIPNQQVAMQMVMLCGFLPGFYALRPDLIKLQNVPVQIRWLSNFIWGRYYIDIVRDALLEGGGWPSEWWKVIIIGVTGSAFYGLAWRNMRRMQLKA